MSKVPGTVSIPDPVCIQWWLDQVDLLSRAGLAGYVEFLSKADARPYLEKIQVPMLILAPARSAVTKLEEQRLI